MRRDANAARITQAIEIPTIGIGSGACDGQILVLEDMLGLSPRVPRYVKKFGKVGEVIEDAVRAYAEDVRSRAFPTPEHTYSMKSPSKSAAGRGAARPDAGHRPRAGPVLRGGRGRREEAVLDALLASPTVPDRLGYFHVPEIPSSFAVKALSVNDAPACPTRASSIPRTRSARDTSDWRSSQSRKSRVDSG